MFFVTVYLAGKGTCLETKFIHVPVSQASQVVKSLLIHHGMYSPPQLFSDKNTHPGWEARSHHHLFSSIAVNITTDSSGEEPEVPIAILAALGYQKLPKRLFCRRECGEPFCRGVVQALCFRWELCQEGSES